MAAVLGRAAPRVLVITDRRATRDRPLVQVVRQAVAGAPEGAAWVQLREKDLDGGALLALARELLPVVRARGGALLINDRIDVALAAGADGVQLPESGFAPRDARALMPGGIVAASTHAAAAASASAADLVVLGPVWATPSKAAYGSPLGLDALAAARRAGGPPLIAVGGIDGAARAAAARAAGAVGVAAIRAVMAAADPAAAVRALCDDATS